MYAFDYRRPATLAEAVSLLGRTEEGKILAGGQTLLPALKQRLARPDALIDISRVPELRGIREDGDGLFIGAVTRHAEVAASEAVTRRIPALADLASRIGDRQVRALGTLGGSIANADPAADYPAAVVALDGVVTTGTREISADRFFIGMFETALDSGEVITGVRFRVPDTAAYVKFRNPASRYAIVGVFVARRGTGVRVAVTGAGPCVFRATDMETALAKDFRADALNGVAVDAANLNGDIHASPEYRAHLVTVMAKRAVEACGQSAPAT